MAPKAVCDTDPVAALVAGPELDVDEGTDVAGAVAAPDPFEALVSPAVLELDTRVV